VLGVSTSEVVQHLVDALSLGSLYALFALGIALIFGVMQLINFAHGELIMAGAFALVLLDGTPLALLFLITLVIVACFALAMERLAFRPVRGATPATLLVISFAVSVLLQNVAALIFSSVPKTTNLGASFSGSFDVAGVSVSNLGAVTVGITILLLALLTLFLAHTRLGVQMRAAAEDFRMARLLGVKANTVIATAFALSGMLAGIASILLIAQTGSVTPTIGITPVLIAFIATILGGMGSLTGAVLGGFLLGSLTVLLQVALPLELRPYRDAIVFAMVFFILTFRPQGLIVARSAETRV
jgi:branched-chain amino acid transport system permease protein